MLMMLVCPFAKLITGSNCWTCWRVQGQKIGKDTQLMLMMLALRLADSVQSMGKTCALLGVLLQGCRQESLKGNPTDADDARLSVR